ncbi:hypothetical protein [Gemmatimonas sp.]|uniref:hypothetical protein n=1 Tax=Gemmatimonas sp. TaxID=1962908 RepID=UPI00286E45DB|nr:hypothetical protein [Gemmatimonas sp.]
MWRTDTPWFMVALIMAIFAIGGVLFGKFEQHRPRGRRAVKQVLLLAVFVLLEVYEGRSWAYGVLALLGVGVVYVRVVAAETRHQRLDGRAVRQLPRPHYAARTRGLVMIAEVTRIGAVRPYIAAALAAPCCHLRTFSVRAMALT